ncbi:MAG: hypothetical protein B7Z78_05290 [Rhodospirillales bacterium 20-60-12]|nr:MAG: hypothetical protein B7Z78_05290 [Rhodospirillales bacterium 20-60-12]
MCVVLQNRVRSDRKIDRCRMPHRPPERANAVVIPQCSKIDLGLIIADVKGNVAVHKFILRHEIFTSCRYFLQYLALTLWLFNLFHQFRLDRNDPSSL